MLNIYIPQPVYGAHPFERLITADLYCKDDHLYLFPAHYPDFFSPLAALQLSQRDQFLSGETMWKPDAITQRFTMSPDTASAPLEIRLGGAYAGAFKLQTAPTLPKVFLTAATLFKDDYPQLEAWVDYHAAQGFERFVLYYNGNIDRILPELLARPALMSRDVLLIQWPYSYWVDGSPKGNEALLAKYGDDTDLSKVRVNWHHAQHLMLNHALVFLRGTTEYIGLFDLDEYFCAKSPPRMVDFIKGYRQDVYIFQSRWAELTSNRVPGWGDDRHFLESEHIEAAAEWEPFPHRTKYIARLDAVYSTRVHYPKTTAGDALITMVPHDLAGVYHFHCFSGKAPRRNFVNPNGEWVTVNDFAHSAPSAERLAA
jgi:hypothetical protein